MPSIEIKIPQLGEGLQEARLIRFLKQPGDAVKQDEPIYEMETDKAVMEIEAPASGVLETWLAGVDDVLAIGAPVGRILTGEEAAVPGSASASAPAAPAAPVQAPVASPASEPLRNAAVPPRTRAYAREKGLSEADLSALAAQAGGKLMPEAIDDYLARSRRAPGPSPDEYRDVPVPAQQRTLVFRLQRSAQSVVPATAEIAIEWGGIESVRSLYKSRYPNDEARQPSRFLVFAWCVAQAAAKHPRLRSALLNDTTLREYAHIHFAIAVARPDDELLMARVANADTLPFEEFVVAAKEAVRRARAGQDQATDVMQMVLTNLSGAGVRHGTPVVVSPAASTLFLGEAYDEAYPLPGGGIGFRRMANVAISFDHRVVNGNGAAAFLADLRACVEGVRDLLGG